MDIFNGYKINNPDGVLNENFDEWQKPFSSGGNSYVNEASSMGQKETSESDEIYDPDKKRSENNSDDNANSSQSGSGTDGQSFSTARPLNALPAVTTVGGGLGTLAGVIASSLATAALVIVVFVSVLTIRLSLVMADVDKLVVQVNMEGAQDEDFLTPIVAVLEGKNGEHREVDIFPDTRFLTFDGLAANEEYTIRVRSGEKLFAENTFVTAAKRRERGSITAYTEGDKVFIVAKDVALKVGEFYSVVAEDGAGKTLFGVDSDESDKTFTFTLDEPTDLYITLGIGGEIYSVCRIKTESSSVYDLENGKWEWTDNNNAIVSFNEIHGGAPLVIVADVVEKTTLKPGCETVGEITFTATAEYDGVVYSDDRTATIPALGHEYGAPTFSWTEASDGYTVTAEFVCVHDTNHKENVTANVASAVTDPTCEKDGFTTYTATVVFGDKQYSDKKVVVDEKSALGHDYGAPTFSWTATSDGYTVTAEFVCVHDANHKENVTANVASAVTDPTCEKDGFTTYTATVVFGDKQYSDKKVVVDEKSALGHDYGAPTFSWTATSDGYTVIAEFVCTHNASHRKEIAADVSAVVTEPTTDTDGFTTYTATVVFDDKEYSDERVAVDENSALGNAYCEPTFMWTETSDGYTVIAEFVNKHDASQNEIVNAEVKVVVTDPTCENDGFTTYTATVIFDGKEYSDEKVVVDEETAFGHDFSQYYEGSNEQPTFVWTKEADGGYTAVAVFCCKNDPSHTIEVDAEIGFEDGVDCTEGGTMYYYASVLFNDCYYTDEKQVAVGPGHKLMPVFHWIIGEETFTVEFYMICERGDYHTDPISVDLVTTEEDGYTLYTATAVYEDVEYTESKTVIKNTEKPLEVGSTYKIGDTISISGTVYFSDGYESAKRTSMSGPTPIVGVGSEDGTQASYDAVILQNDLFVRIDDFGAAAGETPEWLFASSDSEIVGVKITGGSGTAEDPYTLTPVYGVKVTYEANDGVFNVAEGYSVTQYYTEQEVSDGIYAVPIAENPEASGRLFIGWFTDEYATEKFDFDKTPITESIILYAGWIAV